MSAAIVRLHHRTENAKNGVNPPFLDTNLDLIGYDYGDDIPDLSGYERVILCDVSFPAANMIELFRNHGINLIWADHHISAIREVDEALQALQGGSILIPGIRDTQHAACELAWQYFFPNDRLPEIVRLLGRYDCFGHKDTLEERYVLEFQYGARQVINNVESAFYYLTKALEAKDSRVHSYVGSVEAIHTAGVYIYAYLCEDAKVSYKNGFEIGFTNMSWFAAVQAQGIQEGNLPSDDLEYSRRRYRFIAINRDRFNPASFGLDYHADGYDGCACFHFDGKQWRFSLYSENGEVDVSQIAQQYGGGGHKGAAGFRVDDLSLIFS
jgi:hypothetical protein